MKKENTEKIENTENITEDNNKKASFSDKFNVIAFVGIFMLVFTAFLICPKNSFSDNENRPLAAFPEFSFEKLASGEYTKALSKYCSDHFPLRDVFINLKASSEILLGKGENNDVILGEGGALISDIGEPKNIEENLSHIGAFAEKLGIPVYVTLAGRSVDINCDLLPPSYPLNKINKIWSRVDSSMPENVEYINIIDTLKSHKSEYIYYNTDHHWTSLGAYYAYCEIVSSFGDTPYSPSDFNIVTASNEFYGTTWSSAGIPFISADKMDYFRFDGDEDFTVEVRNGKSTVTKKGLYDLDYLQKKDKYSSFITSTTNGLIKITGEGEGRKTILMVKDSFAHTIAPLLSRHYDIIMLDTRYQAITKGSVTKLIEDEKVDLCLFLTGVSALDGNSYELSKLRIN